MKIKVLMVMLSYVFLTGFFGPSYQTVKIETKSGFATEAWVYDSSGDAEKPFGVVYLHGKRGNPGTDYSRRFIERMNDAGYKVVAPVMPWSKKLGYKGTRTQGLETINEAADLFNGQRVVVIGHSMGAMAVLQYGENGTADNVAGLIAVAPGHDPNVSGKIRRRTEDAAQEACQKMSAGDGKARGNYPERSGKREYTINATAEFFCTYFSVNEYPDSREIVKRIKKPTFIVAGDGDRLTKVYSMDEMYESLPENNANSYKLLSGSHKSVLYNNVDEISSWIDSLN
jgi:pimeloyl-ACP methyl ester carboxylesterase